MANGVLFQKLANHNIIDGVSAHQVVNSLRAESALVLLGECYAAVNDETQPDIGSSIFNFLPNSSLAGAPSPCANVGCRIENAYKLSIFGSLYCDKLILPNLFDYFYHYQNDVEKPFTSVDEEKFFIKRFAGDLAVLFQYKPLLDAGIAVIHRTETMVCPNCQRIKRASSSDFENRLDKIYEEMKPRLSKKIEFYRKDARTLEVNDLSNYTGGNFVLVMSDKFRNRLDRISRRAPYKLKPSEIIKSGVLDLVVQNSLYDLMERNYYPDLKGVSYLSNRQIDADFIEASTIVEGSTSPIKSSNLYHNLPFLQDVLIEDVLKIRSDEYSAFIAYRDALTKALKESDATPDELANTYINPALNQINNTIQGNRKYYRAKVGKTIIYTGVAATAGAIVSQILHSPLSPAVATVGTALLSTPSIIPDLADLGTIPKEARDNSYYFLWRVRKESQH